MVQLKSQWHHIHRHQEEHHIEAEGKWVDELPKVIWSHNTVASRTTKFSPFKLLYGEEATTPEEIKFHSWRIEENPHEDLAITIDIIEMVKLQAAANLNKYQDEIRRWKNKKEKPREIKEGDLILQRVLKGKMKGKMNSKWEGPFLVTEMSRPEACRLRTLEGVNDRYSWNKNMLQKYFA
jgi:hypothetical protein